MTARELIKILKQLDEDEPIFIFDGGVICEDVVVLVATTDNENIFFIASYEGLDENTRDEDEADDDS